MDPRYTSTPPFGFTDAWIRDLPDGRYDRFDRGLCLRVYPTGSKMFRWYYQVVDADGSRENRSLVLGPWGHPSGKTDEQLTVNDARALLERAKAAHSTGKLIEFETKMGRRSKSRTMGGGGKTIGELAEEFYRLRIVPKRSVPHEVRRTLDADILPALGKKPLATWAANTAQARQDCRDIVLGVVRRGSPTQAGMVFSHLRQFFRWLRSYGEDLSVNPMDALDKDALGCVQNRRRRYLSEHEIPLFWRAVEKRTGDEVIETGMASCAFSPCGRAARAKGLCYGHYRQMKRGRALVPLEGMSRSVQLGLRILLLVPDRTGELLRAEWKELDLEGAIWIVPIENQKLQPKQIAHAEDRRIPLVPQVLSMFRELKSLAGDSRFVMASSDSESGRLNDKALMRALSRMQAGERRQKGQRIRVPPLLDLPGGHVTVHDLRHTFRTLAPKKCGVLPFFAERCIGHVEGGMEGYYSHDDYFDQRRDALERWTEYVYRLVEPTSSNVSFLPPKGAQSG